MDAFSLSTFYLWHFVDMVRVLNLWKVLEVSPPLEAAGFPARARVLAYRALLVSSFI